MTSAAAAALAFGPAAARSSIADRAVRETSEMQKKILKVKREERWSAGDMRHLGADQSFAAMRFVGRVQGSPDFQHTLGGGLWKRVSQ